MIACRYYLERDYIGVLNSLANQALSSNSTALTHSLQKFPSNPEGVWRRALQQLQYAQIIQWDQNTHITFNSVADARFCAGFWLEQYVYLTAKFLDVDHVASGLVISRKNNPKSQNELDVVIVHNNRILIIECKTSRFGNDQQKEMGILYKNDSIGKDIRGLYGTNWLVSARNIQEAKGIQERANDMGIQVIHFNDLKNIEHHLKQWMED